MAMETTKEKIRSRWTKALLLLLAAVICLAPVLLFGWYQFKHEAADPTQRVKKHESPLSGKPVSETILGFVKEQGVEIAQDGFKPTWGAEEISKDVWIVSYVFEVGRNATWISWEVNMKSGRVLPKDNLARELWYGK